MKAINDKQKFKKEKEQTMPIKRQVEIQPY
jgi:hypothetical protein